MNISATSGPIAIKVMGVGERMHEDLGQIRSELVTLAIDSPYRVIMRKSCGHSSAFILIGSSFLQVTRNHKVDEADTLHTCL